MSDSAPVRALRAEAPLPFDLDNEREVCGSIMVAGEIPLTVTEQGLCRDDFYDSDLGRLFAACLELHGQGLPCDLASVGPASGIDRLQLLDMQTNAYGPQSLPTTVARVVRLARERDAVRATEAVRAAIERGEAWESAAATLAGIAQDSLGNAARQRIVGGLAFAESVADLAAVWGEGQEVLWSEGEALLIVGPDGVGKTTVMQNLALARAGIRDSFLGLPVIPDERPVLYVAADRPTQAAASWARMVATLTDEQREQLDARVRFHKGPLPFNIVQDPTALTLWAKGLGAGSVLLDSLGAIAQRLSSDESGSQVQYAFNYATAAGLELAANYHGRKANGDNKKPNKLEDVYGSRWITAGTGSVLSLWGSAGDPVVSFTHIKQPREPVGPFDLSIDHSTGGVTVHEGTDLWGIFQTAPSDGWTARTFAQHFDGGSDKARENKARRWLESRHKKAQIVRQEGERVDGRGGVKAPDRFYPLDRIHQEPLA